MKDHFDAPADKHVVLVSAGMAMSPIDGHYSGLAGPAVATALLVTCCADRCVSESVFLSMPLPEAGRLIGTMIEYADRAGLDMALQAAIDQGRAWARGAVR